MDEENTDVHQLENLPGSANPADEITVNGVPLLRGEFENDANYHGFLNEENQLVHVVKRRPLAEINPGSIADQLRRVIVQNRAEEVALLNVIQGNRAIAEIYRPPLPDIYIDGYDVPFEITSLMRVYEVNDAIQLFNFGPDFPFLTRTDQVNTALFRLSRSVGQSAPPPPDVPIADAVTSMLENYNGNPHQFLAQIMRQNERLRGPEGPAYPHLFSGNVIETVEQALRDAPMLRTTRRPVLKPRLENWRNALARSYWIHVARIRGWFDLPQIVFGQRLIPHQARKPLEPEPCSKNCSGKSPNKKTEPSKREPQVRHDEHGRPRRELFVYQVTSVYPWYPRIYLPTEQDIYERII